MGVELNGIAHIQLTVNNPGTCLPFWEKFCAFLGMQTLIRNDDTVYCIGARTGILVRAAPPEKRGKQFDQWSAGLHHFCFRARSREDVEAIHDFLLAEPDVVVVGFVLNDVTEKFQLVQFGGTRMGVQLAQSLGSIQDRLARHSNLFHHLRRRLRQWRFGSNPGALEELESAAEGVVPRAA